jgi:hypothetical protein
MGKAIVKSTNQQQNGSSSVSTTLTVSGSSGPVIVGPTTSPQPVAGSGGFGTNPPPTQTVTGVLQDADTGAFINFIQPFGIQLGIAVGVKVNYATVTISGQPIANSLRLLQRGEIMSIDTSGDANNDSVGTLLDKATGNVIPFAMPYCQESGLIPAVPGGAKGTMVHFETVIDPNTALLTAVALEIIGG